MFVPKVEDKEVIILGKRKVRVTPTSPASPLFWLDMFWVVG
jgi:hypothetical protein